MKILKLAAAAALAASASMASAAVVSLDFTGVVDTAQGNSTAVGSFYNGGTSGHGTSGTNLGVEFSANTLAINNYNGCCEPDSAQGKRGILFFLTGSAATLNYAAGFSDGFSFNFASNSAATVSVFDGLNGSGNLLGSLVLPQTADANCPPNASGFYCNWTAGGIAFAGVAKSIDFGGSANFVAYDNITFGSITPGGTVPEPASWAMLIAGFGLVGAAQRRRNVALAA